MITKKKLKKKKRIRILDKILTIGFSLFLILGIVWLVAKNFEMLHKRAQLENKVAELKEEIQKLEKQKIILEGKLKESEKESFLEKQAKERLNLKREGENVVVIEGLERKIEEKARETTKGFWEKMKEKIFGKIQK